MLIAFSVTEVSTETEQPVSKRTQACIVFKTALIATESLGVLQEAKWQSR